MTLFRVLSMFSYTLCIFSFFFSKTWKSEESMKDMWREQILYLSSRHRLSFVNSCLSQSISLHLRFISLNQKLSSDFYIKIADLIHEKFCIRVRPKYYVAFA